MLRDTPTSKHVSVPERTSPADIYRLEEDYVLGLLDRQEQALADAFGDGACGYDEERDRRLDRYRHEAERDEDAAAEYERDSQADADPWYR